MAHVAVTTTLLSVTLKKSKEKWVPKQFDSTSHRRAKPESTHRDSSASKPFKRKHAPPFDLLTYTKTKRHRQNEGKPSSRQGTKCSNCNKFRRIQTNQLISKGLVAHIPSDFCDTNAHLTATNQLPGLVHFLAQHVQGHVATQSHLASSQSCRKREILSPAPYNRMTCNASLHTLQSRRPLEDTLSSSDQASPSLYHTGLCGQPIFHSSPKSGT